MTKDETPIPTRAADVMTTEVVSVTPDATAREIAQVLYRHRFSAVPVVDATELPIGMVSEGDLIGRTDDDRLARRDWWLGLMSGDKPLDEVARAHRNVLSRTARDLMVGPLVVVGPDTPLDEIARLFTVHRIKRVPVVEGGRLVGIVSRADLLRVVAAGLHHPSEQEKTKDYGFLVRMFGGYHRPSWESIPFHPRDGAMANPAEGHFAAADFRHLEQDFHQGELRHREDARRQAAEQRHDRAKELIDRHIGDDAWKQMLHRARVAAQSGEKEFQLLRFPSQLYSDGGRAINVAESGWPATLRGEPAELYLRWEQELKSRGFGLSARVVDFPDGKPGDIGLFLTWGE